MSKKAIVHVMVSVVVAFSTTGLAEPLSVNILDHDFTFDVPYYVNPDTGDKSSAVYDYAGDGPDILRLTDFDPFSFDSVDLPNEGPAGVHNAPSYSFAGQLLPQLPGAPGASPELYPLAFPPQKFGAKLELTMFFDTNDGPYENTTTGDKFDISLTGTSGRLRIRGWIGTPDDPLYPPDGSDIVLLDIEFTKTTLLARANNDTADLEGVGKINTLLGHKIEDLGPVEYEWLRGEVGVTFFKFMLPDTGGVIYPNDYDPLEEYNLRPVYGRIKGDAGLIPEPASMFLLAVGGLGVLRRRRKA